MLADWHEFYGLLGTASAALVALLFVAASIGAGFLDPVRTRGGATRTYMSPVVFHYTGVLFVSLVVLIPSHTQASLGICVGLVAAVGFVYSLVILIRLLKDDIPDLADHFGYGAIPFIAYGAALVAAWLLAKGSIAGPDVLAGALMLVLVVNIRNAWDLTLAFVKRQSEVRAREREQS
jgi:hypothetical protein